MADKVLRGVLMLVCVIIFVVMTDQIMTTPFFTAEIGEKLMQMGVIRSTVVTVIGYLLGGALGALVGYLISPLVIKLI